MGLLDRARAFPGKYRFPIHLVVLWDIGVALCSRAFWTLWARWLLAIQGCRAGRGFRCDGRLIVRTALKGGIRIGDHFAVNERPLSNLVGMSNPAILCCYGEGQITIGDRSGMSAAVISSRAHVRVGSRVLMGGNVRIYDHDFHSLDAMARRDPVQDKATCRVEPVTIGDDVFIGANAIILKGVTVGDRSVIGAGAVVTLREIPPDSLVAGNPARIIR